MQPQSRAILLIWAIVSVCSFVATTQGIAQTKFEKLHVGYSAQAGSLAPIWITKEAGIFRKHGLDVELLFIPGGPTAVAALLSGEVPITVVGGPAVVSSNLAGSDLVMIAGIVNTFAFQIVTVKPITLLSTTERETPRRKPVWRFSRRCRAVRVEAYGYRSERDNDFAVGGTIHASYRDDGGTTRSSCVPTSDHDHGPEARYERASRSG